MHVLDYLKDYPYTIVMAVGNNTHIENWGIFQTILLLLRFLNSREPFRTVRSFLSRMGEQV